MGRAPCCDKANVKRGPWSPEEDATLRNYVEMHGTGGNWIALPHKAGLRRCGKSCRLRWLNYLRPDIKHGNFTEEEDNIIYSLFNNIGSRWSIIASRLPGRTDNDVKNYWNTKLKKRMMSSGSGSPQGFSNNPLSSSSINQPPLPFVPTIKAEENNFSSVNPFDWGFDYFSELPSPTMPTNFVSQHDQTPENSSAASSSIENWSTAFSDPFLFDMGFRSYSEFLNGYGENVAKPQEIHQRVTYS